MNDSRIFIKDLSAHADSEVNIFGWIHVRRDQGKMVFFDFRDMTGIVQGIVLPGSEAMDTAKEVRSEYCVRVTGKVNKRPERMIKEGVLNGDIELEVLNIEVLNESETPPFDLTSDTTGIDEQVKLKHRYLDLRTERLQTNMRTRSEFVQKCREYLFNNHFCEIETPIIAAPTREGSRDFVVPSRHNPGKFYALPQSPQQYKQLLMAGGMDRYFQMARAFRDEDLRADRGFEHTQVDIEMSFVTEEGIRDMVEGMLIETAESMGKVIKQKPFPRITYKDAMETYGADKFDLRTDEEREAGNVLAYAWVVDFPFFEKTKDSDDAMAKGEWTFTHNPFSMPKEEFLEDLMNGTNIENIIAQQYDLVCNGYESGGGSIRAHKPEILRATYKIMGYTDEQIEAGIGHMLKAFSFGTPPHGGIALGVERSIMNITGEPYLREVQAFPMTRSGSTSVMEAPITLPTEQLDELGIIAKRIVKKDSE